MISPTVRKWLAFGSGLGIAVEGTRGAESLRVAAVRVRPSGVRILGEMRLEDVRNRPAAEWGAEYAAFAGKHGMGDVAATVLLPRHDVILRQIGLPGVAAKDLDAAVVFQLDGLHPYAEADVQSAWARLEGSDAAAVAIARRDRLETYGTLFAEAGIKLAGFTASGIAVHSALRMFGTTPVDVFAMTPAAVGVEIYGESAAKPLLSAVFDLGEEATPDRAVALAAAELRFPETPLIVPLAEALRMAPEQAPAVLAYVAALSSACPHLSSPLNLLPLELREVHSPWRWVPTAALGAAAVLALLGMWLLPRYQDGSYLETLNAEIARVGPQAAQAADLDKQAQDAHTRAELLDQLRQQSKADMDVLAAMTTLLAPPAWVRSMSISTGQIQVTGEMEQAAPLVKLLDDSPLFENAEFQSPPARSRNMEAFSVRARRKGTHP